MRSTIEMAREAGGKAQQNKNCDVEYLMSADALEHLVTLARADEREGIAEMFDAPMRLIPFVQNTQGGCVICGFTPSLAAAAIRARGETK
jgi:hypothetical protein